MLLFPFVIDDAELEVLLCIAGIVSHLNTILRHSELATWVLALILEPGIFSPSNQFLRAKFTNLCRGTVRVPCRVLSLSSYVYYNVPAYYIVDNVSR